MKLIRIFILLTLLPFTSGEAMDASKPEDLRLSTRGILSHPKTLKWLSACDRISELANERIIPLLAIQTNVGNDNPGTLTEYEIATLNAWQSFQEGINETVLLNIDKMACPSSNKTIISFKYLAEKIILTITQEFSSFSPSSIIQPPLLRNPGSAFDTRDNFSEIEILEACKQRCLALSFEIKGLGAKRQLITQQMMKYSQIPSADQQIITQLTLKSLGLELELAAAEAQKSMASNTMELIGLLHWLDSATSDAMKSAIRKN